VKVLEEGVLSMGFFQRVSGAVARFMYGRNGLDKLGIASMWLGIALELVSAVLSRHYVTAGNLMYSLSLVVWAVILFRMFSKNLEKRRAENQRWAAFWTRLKGSSNGAVARHADKEHKYFTCTRCKAICRVPVGQGNIIITCPRCGMEIRART